MGNARTYIFLLIFILLALQMGLGFVQVRQYQKAVKRLSGKGRLLGIGQRRGKLKPGELLILVYDREADRTIDVQSMMGYTIFAKFKSVPAYIGLSLNELRTAGIERDAKDMGRYRRRHPYDPNLLTKKKGALIQAVEALDMRFRREEQEKETWDGEDIWPTVALTEPELPQE